MALVIWPGKLVSSPIVFLGGDSAAFAPTAAAEAILALSEGQGWGEMSATGRSLTYDDLMGVLQTLREVTRGL